MFTRRTALALAVPFALATFAGCSSDEATTDTGDETTTTVAESSSTTAAEGGTGGSASAEGIEVTGAWARESPAMAEAGAAYFTITSETADAIVGASVPASVAGTVEMHETVMAGDGEMEGSSTTMGEMSSTTMGGSDSDMGEMTMQPVDEIALPAGEAVELAPGGLHIMLLELAEPLEIGTTIELTLTFETAPPLTIEVPVLAEAPAS